jgi:hypothetical protein
MLPDTAMLPQDIDMFGRLRIAPDLLSKACVTDRGSIR